MKYIHIILIIFQIGVLGVGVESLFIVGLNGKSIDEISKFGGVILFSKDIESANQLRRLIEDLKRSGIKLIAIDHEGTYINRFWRAEAFIPPNAMALGSANDEKLAYLSGYYAALSLRSYGFNVDFAPVLDVNSNPMNPVIGVRSFWSTPERVSRLGIAFMKGLIDGGIIPVVKHFPGHGDTDVDSHTGLPVIDKPLEEFIKDNVEPFKRAVEEGAPAVMTAHVIVKSWDERPATMSKKILGFLRENIGFKGVVVSDDMVMKAVWMYTEDRNEDPILEAFKAGVDLFIISDPEKAKEEAKILNEAIGKDPSLRKRLEESLKRVERLLSSVSEKDVKVDLTPDEVLDKVARKSIASWGERLKERKYALFYPESFLARPKGYTDSIHALKEELEKSGMKITLVGFNPKDPKISVWSGLFDGAIVLSVDVHVYEKEADFIEKLMEDFKEVHLVAIRSPYDILHIEKKPTSYTVTYDWNSHYPKYLAGILTGKLKPLGEFVAPELGGMR